MPLRFVLDEHLRGGGLWQAVRRHNLLGIYLIEMTRVGDPPDLPLGSTDPDILLWAAKEARILVSKDRTTMPGLLAQHLQSGRHSPGVLVIRPRSSIPAVLDFLKAAAHASKPEDWENQVRYIP